MLLRRLSIVALVSLSCGACGPRAEVHQPTKEEVRRVSQELIKAQLLSPGYIQFSNEAEMTIDKLEPSRFRVRGFVDYKGESGMAIRTNYTCVPRYGPRGQWDVEDLKWE
jgi:hypothetical protein